jgi:Putative AphA-like transcriptional regulator
MIATLARKSDPEPLEPHDCVALIVLQTADTGLATIDEMQAAAKQMTHDDWAPTMAVLESCIRSLVRDGLLAVGPATETDHPQGFTTTERGRIAISLLLLRPIPPSQGNFTRLCMSMKLCLFHCLEASQRRSQIAELSKLYLQTLEQMRRLRPRQGQHRSFPTDYWLCHEIERVESELAWLGGLENWLAGRHAAE